MQPNNSESRNDSARVLACQSINTYMSTINYGVCTKSKAIDFTNYYLVRAINQEYLFATDSTDIGDSSVISNAFYATNSQ